MKLFVVCVHMLISLSTNARYDAAFSWRLEYSTMVIVRNLIVAPVTEEIAFRALLIPLLYSAYCTSNTGGSSGGDGMKNTATVGGNNSSFHQLDVSSVSQPTIQQQQLIVSICSGEVSTTVLWRIILICPAYFALAHLHHMIEKIRSGNGVVSTILWGTLVQITYTSIFGIIAAFLFMRTGSVFSPIMSHIICNFVGLPDMGFTVPPPRPALSPTQRISKAGKIVEITTVDRSYVRGRSEYSCMYRYRYILLGCHALGLVMFIVVAMPMTDYFAKNSIYWH